MGSVAWGGSWGDAWGDAWGRSVTPTPTPTPSPDFTQVYFFGQRPRTKEEIRRERERLGILPKRAAAVIRAVAKQAESDELALHDARLEQRLRDAIYEAQLAYRNWYVEVLRDEMRQHDEDEETVLLLI